MSASPLSTLDTGKLQLSYAGDSTQWDSAPTQSSNKPVTSGGLYDQINKLYSQEIENIGTFYRAGNVVQFYALKNLNQGTTIAGFQTLKICDIPAGYRCVLPTGGRVDQAISYQGSYIPGFSLRFYTSALLWSNLSGASITVPQTSYWMETWLTNDALPTS